MSDNGIVVTSVRKKKEVQVRSIISWFFRTIFLGIIIIGVTLGMKAYKKYWPVLEKYYDDAIALVDRSSPSDFKSEQTSYVYDASNRQLAKLRLEKDMQYVEYKDIPGSIINAVVAIEDKRYWEHDGVDWKSTAKAAVLYLKDSDDIQRGGSTITQQLVKNKYLSFEKSLERKCKEILIALQMEKRYTKGQILEFYLNNVCYANGYYGIASAAKGYFNKELSELSLEEIAFLSAIPNNPSLYDPLRNIGNTTKRRNVILEQMYQQGYVSKMEYLVASNSPIHFFKRSKKVYNYEVSYAIDCATRELMKKIGFRFQYSFSSKKSYQKYQRRYERTYQDAKDLLYSGGYHVYTSIDPEKQKKLQQTLDRTLSSFKEKSKEGVYKLQGGCTVIDNSTGNVVAIVGGRKQNFNGIITLNRAYQSFRQPGSTFKPLAVYTPCLEKGYTPNTLVEDKKIEKGPSNSNGKYEGEVTLRHAVESSKNVVAWNVFNDIGPEYGLRFVQNMKFSKIVTQDVNLAAGLGGLTYGVSTVEMASGYCTLANDGVFREPTCIMKIEYPDGRHMDCHRETNRIYSVNSARVMTDVLLGVAKVGTAKGLALERGMPIACKTGTTNNQTNGWFCSYTPYYSIACYVGYDQEKSVPGLWGSTYPLAIAKEMHNYLCKGKKIVQFKKKIVQKKAAPTKNPETTAEPSVTGAPQYKEPSYAPKNEPKKTEPPNEKPTKKPKVTENPEEVIPDPEEPEETEGPGEAEESEEPEEPKEPEEPDEIVDEY